MSVGSWNRLRILAASMALVVLCAVAGAQTATGTQAAAAPQNTAAQPAYEPPVTAPETPVGTTFDASTGKVTRPDTRVAPAVGSDYRIGADDVLTINVWHEPEVSRNVTVRPDGRISLPLVGDVQAAGLTPVQLQNVLTKDFSKYLTNPAVSVIVTAILSQRINVLGQVFRPGTYALVPPMTVLDAIAAAGGLQQFAKANKIYVLRTGPNGQTQRIKVQYKNILKGKHGADNLVLQTRDTVVVP
jgi:polysaccharide export outer membrane protein